MAESDDYTQAARIEWEIKLTMWMITLPEYEKIKRAIERINSLIWRTVSMDELQHYPIGTIVDVKHVINALEARLSSTISSLQLDAWARDLHRDEDSIELTSVIYGFRERYKEMGVLKSHSNALLTLPLLMKDEQADCLCGGRDKWAKCFYLNPSIQPNNWKEREDRRQKINEALQDDGLKRKVDNAIKKASAEKTQVVQERPLEACY
ncbi:hypothetical protein AJ78_03339 [Emergomyces pasteurianus Ep9510]|uniref:Uncharacterized protein n=1 Tax=Emergomyces pasteurianus Ep9510 TaxID=1447872 RepID=A0A1J9QKT6_9EURO|nr:hypothetical protein AJ78_03339 [Emergomyces pasteurianus Ep9510]